MSERVPFLPVGATYAELRTELDAAIQRVLDSGWYLLGGELAAFEAEYAAWTGAAHCVGVANGLDALTLSLRALGVGAGDEVIVPSNTYIATWLAVTYAGATPVPVEPVEGTYNLDPAAIAAAVTPRTRVILPVHLYGLPADMRAIREVAGSYGLRVLDDAAQAHGARYHGDRIGSLADVTAWSFYPGKNLGAFGDGGAITTNDPEIADRLRVLRNYGSRVKYVNEVQGVNSRLDELQAAVLRVKLAHLDAWNARRAHIAAWYGRELAETVLGLPSVPAGLDPAWHLYVVRSPVRDALQRELATRGIDTMIHYPIPPHLQDAYRDLGHGEGSYPIAERIHREVLSLPIGPHLDDGQVERVVAGVRDACQALSVVAGR